MANVFFSYSHEDGELRNRLEKHLSQLKRQGLIDAWHDRRILPGANFGNEISNALEAADIILLLVSADFLASDYCYSTEMKRALERNAMGSAVVIPVILKPCDWKSGPLGAILATPTDGKPITTWANVEEAFAEVATHIRQVVQASDAKSAASGRPASVATQERPSSPTDGKSPATTVPTFRSSNLRLKRTFSEHDRDTYLHQCFEEFAAFFEASLEELSLRNPTIKSAYRRIDANTFTATIYEDGKKASECAIRLGGFGGRGVTYSNNADGHKSGGYNEQLTVEADEQELYFKPLSFGFDSGEGRLSKEAAAERLWAKLMHPLQ